jgi:hypothetical protein
LQGEAEQGILRIVNLDADRVQRVVLGLPEVALRVEWLRDYLESTPSDRAAQALSACARRASVRILVLAKRCSRSRSSLLASEKSRSSDACAGAPKKRVS